MNSLIEKLNNTSSTAYENFGPYVDPDNIETILEQKNDKI